MDFENITNPVLVRERVSEVDRAHFASEANESNIAAMSSTEHAVEDAKRITPAMLSSYDTSKPLPANTDFLNSFISAIPENERGSLVQANGYISRAGLSRALSALTALAYGDSSILSRLNELWEDDIKNVSNALVQAASKMAVLETSDIRPGLSIKDDIAQAVNTLVNIRQQGKTVAEFFAQPDLFPEETLSDTAKTLVQFFDDNKRSSLRIAEGLRSYATFADLEPHANQTSLFDVAHSKQEILDAALTHAQHLTNAESDYTPESLIIAEAANKRLADKMQSIREKSEKQLLKERAKTKAKVEATEEKFTSRISKIKETNSEQREQLKQELSAKKKEAVDKVKTKAAEREAALKAHFKVENGFTQSRLNINPDKQ